MRRLPPSPPISPTSLRPPRPGGDPGRGSGPPKPSRHLLAARLLVTLAVVVAMVPPVGFGLGPVFAATPAGFEDTLVTKVSGPTALAFTPDGRLLITSHFGTLWVYQDGTLKAAPALDYTSRICSDQERGLLGVAVDPAFGSNHAIYLYYTFKKFGVCDLNSSKSPVNRISRFTLSDANVVDPASESILIDNIPQPGGIHSAGDLHFGKDGYLYVSSGDGGCDLDDGARCGSQNDNARQKHILLGKILRITRDGGIPADNPYQGAGTARCNLTGQADIGLRCQETFAEGLRNPFRFAFDPNAAGTRFHINDVGQNTWEEIDLGQAGADYGWNVREGHCARSSTTDCGQPPSGMTNPTYDYQHNTIVPTGSATACNAITGGAFVPNGIWPAAFDGSYLYGDFTCGTIFRLTPGTGGGFTRSEFVTGLGDLSAVVLAFGPDGPGRQALYYTTYNLGGQIRRVAFVGTGNHVPTARASADQTYGPLPLTVRFDGSTSSDPDNDPLTFEWNFGDGSATVSGATAVHQYTVANTYTATLTVRDGRGGVNSATIRIDAGNTPPAPVIQAPATDLRFRVGQPLILQGSATDAEEGTLPDTALSWVVIRHHDAHTHPFVQPTTGNNIPFTGPAPEDLAAAKTSYLEIQLTATDSKGLSRTVVQNLYPHTVEVTFATSPTGLRLDVNATTITAPLTLISWEGYQLTISAPNQTNGAGQAMEFVSWSDGGAATHTFATPATPTTYTATFRPASTQTFTFVAVADARVQEANPTTNFGTSTNLRVDGGSDPDVETYLRFAVSGVSGSVQRATLRLWATTGTANGPPVYSSTNTTWTEAGITWKTKPARTNPRDDKAATGAGTWVEYDVTPFVTGNGPVTLVLVPQSSDGIDFHSREAANKPQLVLTMTTGSTPTPTTSPSSMTLFPEADARVQEPNPTANYGMSAYLRADGGSDPDIESYLRFTVSGAPGPVQSAKLRFFGYNGTNDGPAIYATGNGWGETSINWSNRPARTSGATDDKGAIPDNTWVEFDVTSLVAGNGTYSFILATTSADALYVWSRENPTDKPQLVLVFGSGAAASAANPATATATETTEPTADATATPEETATQTSEETATATPEETAEVQPTAAGAATWVPFADDFEGGDLTHWTRADGLVVQQEEVYRDGGTFAARAIAVDPADIAAPHLARKDLSQAQTEIYYLVRFKVLDRGPNAAGVLGVRSSNNEPILDLYIGRSGRLSYRNYVGDATAASRTLVSEGEWHEVQIRIRIDGDASQTELWYDGQRIGALSRTEDLGTIPIGQIELGDRATGRQYDLAFDGIAMDIDCIGSCPAEPATRATRTPRATPRTQTGDTSEATQVPPTTEAEPPTPDPTATPTPDPTATPELPTPPPTATLESAPTDTPEPTPEVATAPSG